MIQLYLSLRIRQAFRLLKEVGWARILFFTPIAGLILFVMLNFIRQGEHLIPILVFLSMGMLSSHLKRGDKGFMQTLQWPGGLLFSVEYLLVLAPFLLMYALSPQPWLSLILAVIIVVVAWIPFTWVKKQRNLLRRVPLIPALSFEWKSGLRQSGLLLLFLYGLALGFSWEPVVVPIFLLVFSLITTTFYLNGEPLEMIESLGIPGRRLIWLKIRNQLLIFWLLALPFLVLLIIQLWSTWPVILYTFVVCSSLQVIAILYKYALYSPNADLKRNMLFVGLSMVSFFIPPMVPVPIFLLIRNVPKSIHNLNRYLYA